ncbi:MAG TPA: chromosome partitioning protein ParA, partial [Chitinophagales bacterium]
EDIVYDTLIQRNTRLGEAPSFGKPAIMYDAESKGAANYVDLARELLQRNNGTYVRHKEEELDLEEGNN